VFIWQIEGENKGNFKGFERVGDAGIVNALYGFRGKGRWQNISMSGHVH